MNTVSSARWVSIAQAGKNLVQFLAVGILARLLNPSDYGIFALSGVVTGFAFSLRDLGSTTSIIQRKTLTRSFEDTVFWFNIVNGIVLAVVIIALAYPAAHFFESERLAGVLIGLAFMFPISCGSALEQAKLERFGDFKRVAFIEVTSVLVALVAAVVAALEGAGVYTFVIQGLVNVTTAFLLLYVRPGFRFRIPRGTKADARELVGKGSALTSYAMIVYFKGSIDVTIIGKFFGDAVVGSYNVAIKIVLMPMQSVAWALGRALLPTMSAAQDDGPRLASLYFRSMRVITYLSFPCMAVLWVVRDSLIPVLFGSRWIDAAHFMAWIAPVGAVTVIEAVSMTLLVARGRPKLLVVTSGVASVLVGGGMLLGSMLSIDGAMFGLLLGSVASAGIATVYAARELGLTLMAVLRSMLSVALLALTCAAAAFLGLSLVHGHVHGPVVQLAVAVVLAGMAFVVGSAAFTREAALELLSLVNAKRGRQEKAPLAATQLGAPGAESP